MCGHRSLGHLMTVENQWDNWYIEGTQNKNRAKLLRSKAMTFCWRKYLTEAFWVGRYTIIFPGKKKCCLGKNSLLYVQFLMLLVLNVFLKHVSLGNWLTLSILLNKNIVSSVMDVLILSCLNFTEMK